MLRPEIIAWDFDGVLNRNIFAGRFLWADHFEVELGLPLDSFQNFVFHSGRFKEVLRGKLDLTDVLAAWCREVDCPISAQELMDYWFSRDVYPDQMLLDVLRQVQARHVIATNNEAHRARYIMDVMGYVDYVEHMFAAGPMGTPKPERSFFAAIESWSQRPASVHLLVDDLEVNIEAAREAGWQAFHYSDATRPDLMKSLGCL